MPQLIPLALGLAATVGATALGVTGTILGISYAAIIGTVVSLGASMIVGMLTKPRRPVAQGLAEDRKQLVRGSIEPGQVIYGAAKVSGAIVYAASSGANLRFLHLVVVLACHRVSSIGAIWINGTLIEPGDLDAGGNLTNASHPMRNRVRIKRYTGTQTTADADLIAESPDGWAADHVLTDQAYLYIRLEYDQERMPGLQEIQAYVEGRLVLDPRSSTTAFTNNWALCVLDYLRSDFGLGCADDEIDTASFIAAANLSDEAVPLNAGGTITQPRYRCDGAFKLERTAQDITGIMLAAGAGTLVYVQGRYRIHGGAYSAPAVTITEDDFAGPMQVTRHPPRAELFNGVRGTFVDRARQYQAVEFGQVWDNNARTEDGGVEIWRDIELPMVNDRIAAERLAHIMLKRHRNGLRFRAPLKYTAVRFCVWQIVAVTHADFGWSAKPFRITGWDYDPTSGEITVEMQEEQASNYTWLWDQASATPDTPSTSLVNPLTIPTPAAPTLTASAVLNSDGQSVPSIAVTVFPPAQPFLTGMEVEWRPAGGTWQSIPVPPGTTRADIWPVIGGAGYEVRSRARTQLLSSAVSATTSITAVSDTTAPAVPAGLAGTATARGVQLAWTANTDADLDRYRVWERATVGDAFSAVATTYSNQYLRADLEPGTSRRYSVSAVDRTGNESARSAEVVVVAGSLPTASLVGDIPADTVIFEVPSGTPRTATEKLSDTFDASDWGVSTASADNAAAFAAASLGVALRGGGVIYLPAGVYQTSEPVPLRPSVIYEGAGTATIITSTASSKRHTVASLDYDTLSQMRLRTAITLPASGSVTVNLTTAATLVVAQRIAFVSRDGIYRWRGTITAIAGQDVTLSWGAGAAYAAQVGDMVYNLDNAGPAQCGVRNLYIRGSRNTTLGLDNVCQAQTRGSAGALAMNGDRCTIWADGEMRADFQANTRLRFESTGDNSARTITITNARVLQKDGSITTEATMTLAGPGAGAANAVYTPLALCGCSGISIDGAVTGNIWAGIPCGPTAGHGLAIFGPRQIIENVVTQFTRGWGVNCDWGLYAEGWTDSIATQRGVMSNVQVFMADGGGIMLNGPLDCDASELCVNQTYHRTIELGRRALNMRVSNGHVSAAYENSARFIRHFEGVHIEADSATVIGLASEGASNANFNVLANNVTLLEAQPFDPNSSPFAATERAIGVALGDTRTGWAPQNLRASVRGFNLSGGMFDFRFDGGDNNCEGSGYDVSNAITASISNTVTIPAGFTVWYAVGEPVFLRNAAGAVQQFTISGINTGTGVITLSATITIGVAPGALLCRGNLLSGTPHPTTVIDVSAINSATQRLYRRPGGMALVRPDNAANELFLGWPQGGTEAFLLNRAAGALRIGTNNVEAFTLGARGASADVYLPTAAAYATHAAAIAAGLPEGALFYDSVSGDVKRRNASGSEARDVHGTLTLQRAATGVEYRILSMFSGAGRWLIDMGDGSAESGGATGAAGSNFRLGRFRNDGVYLGDAFTISRATGAASFGSSVAAAGQIISNGGDIVLQNRADPYTVYSSNAGRSSAVYVGYDTFYILNGAANMAPYAWAQVGGRWPLTINLTDNYANFGGWVEAQALNSRTDVYANGVYWNNAATPGLVLNKNGAVAGNAALIYGRQGGIDRWHLRICNNEAESGGNAGSNFQLISFADNGAYIDSPLHIRRSDGQATFSSRVQTNTGFVVADTIAGSFTDASRHLQLYSGGWGLSVTTGSLNLLAATGGSVNAYYGGVHAARIEAAGTTAPNAVSVITREKGDARYHPLAGTTASYTPTITGIGGTGATFTINSASWRQDGKWIDWRITLTVTATGTGNTGIRVTAPIAILANAAGAGWENSVTGNAVVARFIGGSSDIDLYYAAFATALCVNGNVVVASGRYETT